MLSFFKHSRVFREPSHLPQILAFYRHRLPTCWIIPLRASVVFQRPKEISNGRTHGSRTPKKTQRYLLALCSNLLGSVGIRSHSNFGWTPGNESIFPENQPGTFWDEEILGVIRDRFLVKPIFREKAGNLKKSLSVTYDIWMWSLILRHFAMKSIMVQDLNENSLATRILDSSSDPQPLKSLSHQFFSTKKPY